MEAEADLSVPERIAAAAAVLLKDCTRVLVFDERGIVLYSNFQVVEPELLPLAATLQDRDAAIRRGLVIQGKRYEVHRHHPPVVYGRSVWPGADAESNEGAAICRTEGGLAGCPIYSVITFELPHVTARMVPLLEEFARENLQAS